LRGKRTRHPGIPSRRAAPPGYARERIAQAAERLRARVYPQRAAVEDLELAGPCGRATHQEARLLPYRPARAGEPLGPLFATYWLRGGAAAAFNARLHWAGGVAAGAWPAAGGGLVLDTVKRAEDGDGLVLRLYEPHGARGVATVRLARGIRAAQRANLLEEPLSDAELRDGAVLVPFRPWEIVTLLPA
jgi:hypothetical protein